MTGMYAYVHAEDCIGCTICEQVCPVDTIDMVAGEGARGEHDVAEVRPDDCVGCAECLTACPVDCITMDVPGDVDGDATMEFDLVSRATSQAD